MSTPKSLFSKYGAMWEKDTNALAIELACIGLGGQWTNKAGVKCGAGLFEHFMNVRKLLWPDRYRHRWTDLIYQSYVKNMVTILMGCGSSQKTSGACELILIDYWSRPHDTMVLLSTTTVAKLDSAIFSEVKMLFESARQIYGWLPGNVIDSKHAIVTDDLEEKETRDMRKGIVGKACFVGNKYVGLGTFAGLKQKRIRFVADELQFMASTFLDCLPNMFQSAGLDAAGDPDVKVIGSGNPKHDPSDMLSVAAEPVSGWPSVAGITKTTVWPIKFHRGECINLIGTDSPNFDVPEGVRPPYDQLISRNTIAMVEKRWGKNSMQYYSQCEGKMMMNMVGNRVITKDLCDQHRAFDNVVWSDNNQMRVGFLDPSYSANGDRCVWGWLEFGINVEGKMILSFGGYKIIPFAAVSNTTPEDQIAHFVQREASHLVIEPVNIAYDSTGKGTIGAAFARVFGDEVPMPVYFGGNPTARPVRHDLYVMEKDGTKRLKRCDEEYRKFVSELWFASRNVIECGQMRNLPEEVAREGYMREYALAPGGKIEVETKADTKERMGCSPDLYDAFVTGIEIARQRGFVIERLGEDIIESKSEDDYFAAEATKYQAAIKSKLLNHV